MIPDGWQISNVARLASEPVSYGVVQTGVPVNGGIPCVRVVDLASGEPLRERMITTSRAISDSYKRTILKHGDVMIALRGIIGRAALVPPKLAGCNLTRGIARVSPDHSIVQSDFLFHSLNGPDFQNLINRQANGSALQEISIATLRNARVLLPPLPEQRRIAEILSTWDRAIETVEAQIANARAQKKALMQSLLTGERRLPGFSEEWPVTSLGQLGETYGGLTGKSKADFGQGHPFITYKNVFDNAVVDPKNVELVTVDKAERQHRIRLGDILFTTSSETPNDVGMSSVVAFEPGDTYLNSFCFGFRPNAVESIVPEFAAHFFRCEEMRIKIAALAQGSTRYNISKGQLLKLRFALPGSNEQQAIAGVLDAAESEIGRLKAQLVALRKEKSALMQQLLTGKRRVKVDLEEETC